MPPPDKALVRHLLAILHRIGPAGVEERALVVELETAADRPLPTQEAKDAILFGRDRGWVASRVDDFFATRWWLTEAGKTMHASL